MVEHCYLGVTPLPPTSATDFTLLRLLATHPRLTQRRMAHEMGVSVGKANYCLRALVGKGFVKVRNFRNSSHKRAYAYVLTPEGAAAKIELTKRFLEIKREEFDQLRGEIERLQQEAWDA